MNRPQVDHFPSGVLVYFPSGASTKCMLQKYHDEGDGEPDAVVPPAFDVLGRRVFSVAIDAFGFHHIHHRRHPASRAGSTRTGPPFSLSRESPHGEKGAAIVMRWGAH
jgi:hypothetical protein